MQLFNFERGRLPSQQQWQPNAAIRQANGNGLVPLQEPPQAPADRGVFSASGPEQNEFTIFITAPPSSVTFCSQVNLPPYAVPAVFNDAAHPRPPHHPGIPYPARAFRNPVGAPLTPDGGMEPERPRFEHIANLTREKLFKMIRQRIELFPVKGLKNIAHKMVVQIDPEKRQNNSYNKGNMPEYWPQTAEGRSVWDAGIFHAKGDDLKEFVAHIICLPVIMPEQADELLWRAQDRITDTTPWRYTELLDQGTRNLEIFAKDVKNIPDNKKPFEKFRLVQYRAFLLSTFRLAYQIIENWSTAEGQDIWVEAPPAHEVRRYNEYLRTEFEKVSDQYTFYASRRIPLYGTHPRSVSLKRSASFDDTDVKLSRETPEMDVTGSRRRDLAQMDMREVTRLAREGVPLENLPLSERFLAERFRRELDERYQRDHASVESGWASHDDSDDELPSSSQYEPPVHDHTAHRRQWQRRADATHDSVTLPAMVLSPAMQGHPTVAHHRHYSNTNGSNANQNPCFPVGCPEAHYPSPTSKHEGTPPVGQSFEDHVPLDGELFELVDYPHHQSEYPE